MSQFALLGLILLLQTTAVVQIVHRLFLVIRTPKYDGKRWKTATPEMRAWRLSAVEPLVTTLVTIPALFLASALLFDGENPAVLRTLSLYTIPILSMTRTGWLINKHGERCRLGRLANTVIGARVFLLTVSAFFFARHADLLDNRFSQFPVWAVITPILCAFFIRAVFAVHQNLVIDKMDVEAVTARERTVPLIENDENDENDDKNELWDEQVALIEQLKAEEWVEVRV